MLRLLKPVIQLRDVVGGRRNAENQNQQKNAKNIKIRNNVERRDAFGLRRNENVEEDGNMTLCFCDELNHSHGVMLMFIKLRTPSFML